MAENNYFIRITGAFIIGVISLLMAIASFLIFWRLIVPVVREILPFVIGPVLILAAVVFVWILIYFLMMLGVVLYYAATHPAGIRVMEKRRLPERKIEVKKKAGRRPKRRRAGKPVKRKAKK